jgi:hypothetical protein
MRAAQITDAMIFTGKSRALIGVLIFLCFGMR